MEYIGGGVGTGSELDILVGGDWIFHNVGIGMDGREVVPNGHAGKIS